MSVHPKIAEAQSVYCNECYAMPGDPCTDDQDREISQVHWTRGLSAEKLLLTRAVREYLWAVYEIDPNENLGDISGDCTGEVGDLVDALERWGARWPA